MGAGASAPRSRESGPSKPASRGSGPSVPSASSRGSGTGVSGSHGVRRSKSWAVVKTSRLGDRSLSSSFKVQLQCALHEFGTQRGCRSENYLQQRGFGALVGIHSNWIGHFILAAARPTNRILDEHHLIYQLHSQHIGAVINLQEPDEHFGCGEGLAPGSAFSYNPERFMENHVYYFNFPIKDVKSVDPSYMLDICHTIDSQITLGDKVMVHCHSGVGRTGVVIGCYFVYSGAYEDPTEAIQAIRTFRHGTFKRAYQTQMVKDFEAFLMKLRVNFVSPDKIVKRVGDVPGYPNIIEHMSRQKKALHGLERRALLYVPKEKVNVADWGGVEELEVSTLCHLLLGWLRQLQEPIVPDNIATTALGRGDIESAIEELEKADKISFATIQILACFIFQIVPVKPKLIRQLYSALANVLLVSSSLQNTTKLEEIVPEDETIPAAAADKSKVISPNTSRRHSVSKMNNVYTKYKPTLLEIEYGLLLEASARFWIKLGKAKQANSGAKGKSKASTSTPAASSSLPANKEKKPIFSQPWFRDRASLLFEEYNPVAEAIQHQKDLETNDDASPSTASSKTASFVEPTAPTPPRNPSPPKSPRSPRQKPHLSLLGTT
ncbi:protein tyrosine phosphatase domain-containing protein 1 [Marchantia polymorpha subsp. ruderalis]|uniref:Tyrosine specific protein phosphatases domain-containing protein n=2 Tax=Marchantia polymorpha TaxID=3197 RepID=A0AAF6BRQ9_MARPO|nr:hypothetical protein MARPO_0047s0022 [Marchantia polymorpha]BBN14693.1 hypothetical protein Mp_6g13710 [Marchantia polymorpha subsp. ruderalis]|eukprot:PTQ39036.1 hypothetical protein MARPO_0047s0022 [Marchantia polymorpha]